MNAIREFFVGRKVYVALIGGAVLGLIIGLVIGWVLWPVQWLNSTPAQLRSDFRQDYVMYIVEKYEERGIGWAEQKLGVEHWDEAQLAETFAQLEEGQGGDTLTRIRNLRDGLMVSAATEPEVSEPPAEEQPLIRRLQPFLMVCGVALVVAAIVGGVLLFVGRTRRGADVGGDGRGREAEGDLEEVFGGEGAALAAATAPEAQFVTSYSLGDDHYDPSFSIELETGEFMGECGVGISDTLSSGEPSKVTAFEIWLFDKNDIRTVTKVLMSEYAFGDEALRTKLAPKGEPILAEIGDEVVLETKRLRVQARVLDLGYGSGELPANSFFSKLTLDLSAWVKPDQETRRVMAAEGPYM